MSPFDCHKQVKRNVNDATQRDCKGGLMIAEEYGPYRSKLAEMLQGLGTVSGGHVARINVSKRYIIIEPLNTCPV